MGASLPPANRAPASTLLPRPFPLSRMFFANQNPAYALNVTHMLPLRGLLWSFQPEGPLSNVPASLSRDSQGVGRWGPGLGDAWPGSGQWFRPALPSLLHLPLGLQAKRPSFVNTLTHIVSSVNVPSQVTKVTQSSILGKPPIWGAEILPVQQIRRRNYLEYW